jgi:hypothetical protein
VELGTHTICMQVGKALEKGETYFGNVALKLNVKLGGINHKVRFCHLFIYFTILTTIFLVGRPDLVDEKINYDGWD